MHFPAPRALRAVMANLLALVGAVAPLSAQVSDDASVRRGEKLGADAIGPVRFIDPVELTELEKTTAKDLQVKRMRGDAHGQWAVKYSNHTTSSYSGRAYLLNKWGDTSMGIGFGERVHVEGVWIAGQETSGAWPPEVVVIGYRAGVEVGRTEPFTDIDETHTWLQMDLVDVDRIVFEASPATGGAAWFALDDLTYSSPGRGGERERAVVGFDDLPNKHVLTGTGYAGLRWEEGTGTFEQDARVIEQPLTSGDPELGDTSGSGSFLGGSGTAPTLVQDFTGTKMFDPGAGYIPPDTCGAVGINHFVEVVNTNISVWNRVTQARQVNLSLSSFFGIASSPGDPRVVFDVHSQRWFVIATNFSDRIYVAVSDTSDPTGGWFTSYYLTSQGSDAGKWPDYPTLGVDANGLYSCSAMFGGSSVTMTIFAIDKAPLLAGSPSLGTVTAFRNFGWEAAMQPAVTYGNPSGEFIISRWNSTRLRLREVRPPMTSPTLIDHGNVNIPSHSFPPDAPALGSSTDLDSVDYRPMNSVYRNGSIWTIHTIDVSGRAALRWYEIDVSSGTTNQVGTIDHPSLSFVMPSIAVNSRGDCVMGFSGSSSAQYAASYYTGRLATDAPGQVAPPILLKSGEGAYERLDSYGRNRWGDYSLTSVDPIDDLGFWTVQEYARPSNRWGTWLAELDYPGLSDCNSNGIEDAVDIATGTSLDCNLNGIPDECDISAGISQDCNANDIPDDCEADCNSNGVPDDCDLSSGTSLDCNSNSSPDECDIASGISVDCNNNGIPDECDSGASDCNSNGTPDECDISTGTSFDCNGNGVPDECDISSGAIPDCNSNGIPDDCEQDCDANGIPDVCDIANGGETDCNNNGLMDSCEIDAGFALDCNNNGLPDTCELDNDCNGNNQPDDCDIANGTSVDCNSNGLPDECEPDCNSNGSPDDCDIGSGISLDCNLNGIPDECDIAAGADDCDGNGVPDECESLDDCNQNGSPDLCDIANGASIDCNSNGTPDECETGDDCNSNGVPDECEPDCNGNGTPDDCDLSSGTAPDCNSNGIIDECEIDLGLTPDCNGNNIPDTCDITAGTSLDCDSNGVPDSCDIASGAADCNENGILDSCDIANGTSGDQDGNGVPDECECLIFRYCETSPNSAGPGALIGWSGVPSISSNALILRASECPNNQFGIFYYGPNQIQLAFGDGWRCIGGGTTRLNVTTTNVLGNAAWNFDVTATPPGGDVITAGSTWNFQFWYRDPFSGSAGFNLTDAASITWCE